MDNHLIFCIVIEDEPLAQQLLENYINKIDQLKLVAKCDQLEKVFEMLESTHVDVVFLDLELNSFGGIDIIRYMKKEDHKKYYIIITSAASPKEIDINRVFNTPNIVFIDYLRKPFSFDVFKNAINKLQEILKKDN